MKFSCENCGAKFQIADEKIGPRGAKVRCRRCDETIFLSAPSAVDAAPDSDPSGPVDSDSAPDDEASFSEAVSSGVSEDELEVSDGADSTESGEGEGTDALPSIGLELGSIDVGAFDDDATDDERSAALFSNAADAVADGAEAADTSESSSAGDVFASGEDAGDRSDGLEELRERNELLDMQASLQAELAHDLDLEPPDRHDPGRVAVELGSAFEAMFGAEGLRGDRVPSSSAGAEAFPETPSNGASGEPAEWFVAIRDEQVGPLTRTELESRWNASEISPATLSWKRGLSGWVPIAEIEELTSLPGFAQRLAQTDPDSEDLSYEGFPDIARPTSTASAPVAEADSATAWRPSAASALDSLADEEIAEARTAATAAPDLSVPAPSPFSAAAPPAASASGPTFSDAPFGADPSAAATPAAPAYPPAAPTALPPRRSRPWLWAAPLALLILVGGVAAAYSLLGGGGGSQRIAGYEPPEATPSEAAGLTGAAAAAAADAGASTDAGTDAAGATAAGDVGPAPDASGAQLVEEPAEPERDEPRPAAAPGGRAEKPSGRAVQRPRPPRPPPRPRPRPTTSPSSEDELLGSHGTGVPEKLSAEEVKRVLRNNAADVKRCVAIQAKADPSVQGQLTVQMVLPGDGRPRRVTVVPAQLRDAPVGQCLIKSVQAWRFPRFSGSAVPVKFPVFVRGG